MKNFTNNFIRYVVNLIIAVFLSFSFVYAFTTTLKMTYGAKDVFFLVCFASIICSITFASRLSVKIFAVASALAAVGGLFYFLKKPSVFQLVYSKTVSAFLWLEGYISGQVPLSMEYQKYALVALSIVISLAVYIFAVKKYNFYVLLIGGAALFAGQWMLDYFVSYFSFYIFVFLILVCYFKHIYLINTAAGQSASRQVPAAFLLLSVPICVLVFIIAYFVPARDAPIELNWMDSKIGSAHGYVKTRLNIGNTEYFAISSTGFGEDGSRLGGNVTLDDTIVMKVDSPEGSIYLKGAVRELYTGFSWESADSGLTGLGRQHELDNFNTDLFELSEGSRLISGGINVLNELFNKTFIKITYDNLKTKTLFISAKTESLKFDAGPLNILLDSYGIPSSENFLGNQFQYTIEQYSIKKNNEGVAQLLRNSSRGLYNKYIESGFTRSTQHPRNIALRDVTRLAQVSRDVHARYLQLPAELPERVRRLALEITSSAKNDYDRAKAIESYLAKNYRYTMEPGTTPKDRDFVDYFLFDLKQGYCTYYASAMTVLARSIGIPARYVEGYVLPSQPALGTAYEVTNKQAHAWVEVYFEGFGWIPFEPTSEQTSSAENSTPAQPNSEQNNPANDSTSSQDDSAATPVSTGMGAGIGAQALPFAKLVVPAFIVLLMLWAAAFSPLRRKLRLHGLQRLTPQQGVIEMYRHVLRALSVQGFQIKPGETPLQYAHRIDESLEFKPSSFKTVTDAFIKARYSSMSIDEKEIQLVLEFYSAFPAQCKERAGWLRYFVYNNLLGLI